MTINYTAEILDSLRVVLTELFPQIDVAVNRVRRYTKDREYPALNIRQGSLNPTEGSTFAQVMNDLNISITLVDRDVDSTKLMARMDLMRWQIRQMMRTRNPLGLSYIQAIGVLEGPEPEDEDSATFVTVEMEFRFSILFLSDY